MAGNTKRIRGDAAGKPAPQYFSNLNDAYEYLEGENGASKVMAETGAIVDLETVKNLLAVLGTIEDADSLNTMIGLLKNLKGKDFATQTTLAAVLTELTAIKDTDGIKKIVDALPAGTNEIGKIAADAGKIADLATVSSNVSDFLGVGRTYDKIIDTIGAESMKALMPMWEESGDLRDMFHSGIEMCGNSPSQLYRQDGLLHPMFFPTAYSGIYEKPVEKNSESAVGSVNITDASQKVAQKIELDSARIISKCTISIKKVGTISTATQTKVVIYSDDSGPDIVVGETALNVLYDTSYRNIGFRFDDVVELEAGTYWLSLEVESSAELDASNYISVALDDGTSYAKGYGFYDGAAWGFENYDLLFAIYDNHFRFDDESLSIIIVAKPETAIGINRGLALMTGSKMPLRMAFEEDKGLYFRIWDNSIREAYIREPMPNDFAVFALTVDKASLDNKITAYINGRVKKSISGASGVGITDSTQPFALSMLGNAYGSFDLGGSWRIGPVILTNNALTDSQVADITQLIMMKRKLNWSV